MSRCSKASSPAEARTAPTELGGSDARRPILGHDILERVGREVAACFNAHEVTDLTAVIAPLRPGRIRQVGPEVEMFGPKLAAEDGADPTSAKESRWLPCTSRGWTGPSRGGPSRKKVVD